MWNLSFNLDLFTLEVYFHLVFLNIQIGQYIFQAFLLCSLFFFQIFEYDLSQFRIIQRRGVFLDELLASFQFVDGAVCLIIDFLICELFVKNVKNIVIYSAESVVSE